MIQTLISAEIKVCPVVTCKKCGAQAYSSTTICTNTGKMTLDDFNGEIEKCLKNKFIQPPIGWAVNGRLDYRCPNCFK